MRFNAEIIKELSHSKNRTKSDVQRVACMYGVSTATIYRWMKHNEGQELQELTGNYQTPVLKNTRFYRSDPDYNYIIDQEISHYRPLEEEESKMLTSTVTGFNRRYLTIKTTHEMIIKRLSTINTSRELDNQFDLPSYQAIWKRIKSQENQSIEIS